MNFIFKYIATLFIWMEFVTSISPSNNIIHSMDDSIGDIVDYITSKGYFPNEQDLPRAPVIKNNDNDVNYLLSKLSDEELLKLLNEQPPRNEYNLNDIIRIAFDIKTGSKNVLQPQRDLILNKNPNILGDLSTESKSFHTLANNKPLPYYRLNHKLVESYMGQSNAKYMALQKLKNFLNVYPQSKMEDTYDNKKQLIFDILVAQLKTLCCKKSKEPDANRGQYKTFINEILPPLLKQKNNIQSHESTVFDVNNKYNEYIFLIINDEIKSNGSDELIEVDPESLGGNSSVLLLGPVTSALTDDQLKSVMSRISNELTKPEYISPLQQLSNGVINDSNKNLMKNFIFGPKTRRYIKPHRCNHQSKLAKVYGGPKWLVCTGYLNLNKPSLYD